MKWELGRRESGYWKLKLWQVAVTDAYLLYYPTGSTIEPHVDPVPGKRHYRFNIEIKKADEGGTLVVNKPIWQWDRFCFFRSDISEHSVTRIVRGTRYTLTFGWAIK